MKWVPPTHLLRAAVVATSVLANPMTCRPGAAFDAPLSTEAVRPEAARRDIATGPPDDFAGRIIAAEGGPARNPSSSAAGYGQFLSGTWLEIFSRAYPQVATIMSREQILALREVKPLAEDLINRYAHANAVWLRRIGLPATETTLSLAHAVGPGGAVNILTSAPTRPVGELLSPEAIAANPFLKEMTAGALQSWAVNRVRLPAEPHQPETPAARREDALEPVTPAEDFPIDSRTKASEAWVANRQAAALLDNLLDAVGKTGAMKAAKAATFGAATTAWLNWVGVDPAGLLLADPTTVRTFDKIAARVVLDTIHGVSSRPQYREFQAIEHNAGRHGNLPPRVTRELALALKEKMRQENANIANIVQHRRHSSDDRAMAKNYAPGTLQNISTGRGAAQLNAPR
jgi:hypothetical protein